MAWAWYAALLLALPTLAAPNEAQAQQTSPPGIPVQRVGPGATPPATPPYATPAEMPSGQAATPSAPADPRPAPATSGTFTEVRVTAEGAGAGAVPPRDWRPLQDRASALTLQHTAGEPLNAEWVRRQFAANGLSAGSVSADRSLALVQLINRAFLTAGFVNSGLIVSRQTSLGGVLDLNLIYGRLTAPGAETLPVTVEWQGRGSRGLTPAYIRNRLASAVEQPVNATRIERDFRLLAQDPAIRTVSADLRPGSRPGQASLHLIILPQDPFDVYFTAANNRSPSVGGERAAAGGYLRNFVTAGDIFSWEAGRTGGLTDSTAAFVTPFLQRRTFLSIRGSLNNAAVVDEALTALDIRSRDRAAEAGITHRLIERPLTPSTTPGRWSPAGELSVGLLLAHRQSRSFLRGQPFSFSPGSIDGRSQYTALRFVADAVTRSVNEVLALSLTGTLGLDGTRSGDAMIPTPGRRFKSLLASLNYARRLNENGLEVRARLTGQIASSVLYSGERLAVGGESTVRGYRENLLLADEGIVGSVEILQPFSLTGGRRNAIGLDPGAFTVGAFADAAKVGNVDATQPRQRELYSLGAALAWNPSEAIFARISYAHALNHIRQTGTRDIQDRGFHFQLTLYPLRLLGR